jgi:hypothetical protein
VSPSTTVIGHGPHSSAPPIVTHIGAHMGTDSIFLHSSAGMGLNRVPWIPLRAGVQIRVHRTKRHLEISIKISTYTQTA